MKLTGLRGLQAEINAAGMGDPRDARIAELEASVARWRRFMLTGFALLHPDYATPKEGALFEIDWHRHRAGRTDGVKAQGDVGVADALQALVDAGDLEG